MSEMGDGGSSVVYGVFRPISVRTGNIHGVTYDFESEITTIFDCAEQVITDTIKEGCRSDCTSCIDSLEEITDILDDAKQQVTDFFDTVSILPCRLATVGLHSVNSVKLCLYHLL